MRTTETDVLVVGAGPAGLTASALLARSGVGAITVTKYPRLMTRGSGPARRADYDSASPSALVNAPQHVLEPIILNAARSHGADIRFSTELVSITQDENAVQAVVQERDSGEEYTIAARYAIGADGGRSTVAAQIGFPL